MNSQNGVVEEKQKWMRMSEIGAERKKKGRPCTYKSLKDGSEKERKRREGFVEMAKLCDIASYNIFGQCLADRRG